MLTPDHITREALYEAVWDQPLGTVAKELGLSGKGLAKIAQKLKVPVPGRGYWARRRAAGRDERPPLPTVPRDHPTSHRVGQPTGSELARTTRAVEARLKADGRGLPRVEATEGEDPLHPFLAGFHPELLKAALDADDMRRSRRCPEVTVTAGFLDRSLRMLHKIRSAFQRQGWDLEVTEPDPSHVDVWGRAKPLPSLTGFRMFGVFVRIGIREPYDLVLEPGEPPPGGSRARTSVTIPAPPVLRKRASGELNLLILEPEIPGFRRRWRDTSRKRLEDQLDGFLKAVCETAQQERVRQDRWELERREQEARRRLAEAEAARIQALARRRADLQARVEAWERSRSLAGFLESLPAGMTSDPGLAEWLSWARQEARELAEAAYRGLPEPVQPAAGSQSRTAPSDHLLRLESDLWQQRYIYGRRP